MSKVQVTGTLIHKGTEQVLSEKFRKSEAVIIVSNGRYDDYIKFEVVNDTISLLEKVKIMDEVVADGYLAGRKYVDATGETKYITNLRLRNIFPASSSSAGTFQPDELNAPF